MKRTSISSQPPFKRQKLPPETEKSCLGKEQRGRSALLFGPKMRSTIARFRLRRDSGVPDYTGKDGLSNGRSEGFYVSRCCGMRKIAALLVKSRERSSRCGGPAHLHHAMMLALFLAASRQIGLS
jgi:hypothetical protein